MIDDVVVACEDPVGEPVVAHELPDVLLGVQFRGARRQRQEGDVGGHVEPAGEMPARLIQDHDGMRIRRDRDADLFKMSLHGRCIAPRHDESGTFALHRTDGAEDVGRDRALIVRRPWARTAFGPSAGQLVLLPDASFILEPDFNLDAGSDLFPDRGQLGGEVFLNVSIASAFWA